MNWWDVPNDIVFFSVQSNPSELRGRHCPQPNDPMDFADAPKFVIHDFTIKPDGDVMMFKDGVFTIGSMTYKTDEGFDLGLEPLHLYEIKDEPYE